MNSELLIVVTNKSSHTITIIIKMLCDHPVTPSNDKLLRLVGIRREESQKHNVY
jgi:hypothetical protein